MKRVLNGIGCLMFFWLLLSIPVSAAERVPILLNGSATAYTGWLQEGKMLLPIAFLEEMGSAVELERTAEQVLIHRGDLTLVFFIGQDQAEINGSRVSLGMTPVWQEGAIDLPLRFTMESLGAQVQWDAGRRQVDLIWQPSVTESGPVKVFAYYYYPAHEELKARGHLFTDLALRWFETNGQGDLFYEYKDDYAKVLGLAKEMGIKTHASVVLMGKAPLHELLSVPKNRQHLIDQLVKTSAQYDGINIDFELMDPADGVYLTLFLQQLKEALPQDKLLSAAVFARTAGDRWATPYEYDRIGEICDLVVVMSYDYSYPGSDPGPVAPLWWVEKVADYMQDHMASEKIFMGVANYGYDFAQNGRTKSVTRSSLDVISGNYQVSRSFDRTSMSPYYTYWDAAGELHYVWLENEESLQAKYDLIQSRGLGGISFWRIGTGFQDIYKVLSGS